MADQVRFPSGCLALQLQPFDETQVRRWLDVWARHNKAVLAQRRLLPLSPETALVHGDLAEQPLLLLMLAIFDADDNALQRVQTDIGRAELYERLLSDFADREINKSASYRSRSSTSQRDLAERELQRLALVALGNVRPGTTSCQRGRT